MELESEDGQSAAMQQQWLDLDSQVRAEANLGIQQIRNIEQQLRAAPQGFLGRADGAEGRTIIITASVEIVGHFTKIIGRLSAANPNNSTSYRNDNFSAADRMNIRAESPLSSSHTTYDSSPPHSPQHNTRVPAAAAAAHSKIPTSQHNSSSPCHTPHSGTSEDSPNPPSPPVHLDSDGVAATSADPEVVKRRNLSVKRKFMPKVTVKQLATGTDPGNDGPPDDGHTWRKYGQKDILGSTNPRSYYRCTHKIELGCPATKFVQRRDDEPSAFDVTYRGNHTCHSIIHQQFPWPFYTPEQLAMIQAHHQLPRSDPTSSPAIASFPSFIGSIVSSSSSAQQNQAIADSNEILLGGSRPVFSQPPATGGVPCALRFGSSSCSIESQQDFSVNPPQPDTYDLRNLIQVTRDGLFGPESNLYNTLLASTRLEQNVIPSTSAEVSLECHGDLKRGKMEQQMDSTRSTSSDNSGLVDKSSDVVRNLQIWGEHIDANSFQSLGLDEQQVLSRFGNNSSIIEDSGQSRRELPNNRPASAMRGPIDSIRESDTSEQRPSQFNIGSVDITDYEIFTSGHSYFTC